MKQLKTAILKGRQFAHDLHGFIVYRRMTYVPVKEIIAIIVHTIESLCSMPFYHFRTINFVSYYWLIY